MSHSFTAEQRSRKARANRACQKDKIRVTIIEPGAVATELTDHIAHSASKERIKSWVQSMTALEIEDIAAAIVYTVTQPPHASVNEILIRPTE